MPRACHIVFVAIVSCLASSLSAEDKDKPATARKPWTTSRLHGSPEPPEPYKVVSSFPDLKFNRPTCIEEIPGQNRLLVTEMSGKVFSFPKDAKVAAAHLVIDLAAILPKELAGRSVSLFDAEFHPKFKDNHQLFVCYVHPDKGGHTRVSRFTLTADAPPKADAKSEEVIITWPSGGHNGGCLEFGKDTMLYISTGDGSGPNPPDGRTSGQDVSDLLGAILRIDVNKKSGDKLYTIPADNPFVENNAGLPEIWAYGLRNPWKFGVDTQTGNIFAADNGWETWEMVHKIVRGGNCGWPVMEGRASLRSEVKPGPTPILPPVKDHHHSEANSVIGGPVYRGDKNKSLDGSFIYGDYITGTLWAIRPDKDNSYTHTTLCDTDLRIVAFTQGSGGEIYVLDYDLTGQIYELIPSGLKDTTATFPRRLSETGLFKSLKTMEPADGVVPYEVIVPRWMDGAKGERFIAIPGAGKVAHAAGKDKPAVYPEGTVIAKNLTLQEGDKAPIRLETQILHLENGAWHPYSYLWDDGGQEATLVESIGGSRPIQPADAPARTWHVNAVNECKLCHNAESSNVLGFVPSQLSPDSVTALAEQGIFQPLRISEQDSPALVKPHDSSNNLDARARSYLHVNCSMCHQPGGNAIVSFYLRRDMPFDKLNTHKGTGIGTFGMQNAKIIVPSDPYRSVLMYRMSKLGYARMPYIGSRVVDGAGVALIEDWIRSLPPDESDGKNSAPRRADSAEAKALHLLTQVDGSSAESRKQALATLTSSSEGALALIGQLHRGTITRGDSKDALALGSAAKSDIRGLFETFIPEGQRRPTLGPTFDPQIVLKLEGNHDRGKLIFFSDGARCRNCHETDDKSKSVGPTLLDIAKKYPKANDLLEHVLKPSLKIDEPFAAYTLLTTGGQTHSGLLVEKTDEEVVLKTAEKLTVRTKAADIEALKKSDKSLMPDRILSDLTPQEAADLMEYIRSQGGGK
ncbi:MAG: PQQ-dependent sugar dehydrogenase [Pirellulaceae bacterium]|nr:PQQ-dependent sugar dehydrogenase [Pirellulaceae bacterium]